MAYSEPEIKRALDLLGNEFTLQTKNGWTSVSKEYGYKILGGDYGQRGQYRQLSKLQQMGIYPKAGLYGRAGVPFSEAFYQYGKTTPWGHVTQREAKLHLTRFLFGQQGGMGKRFRSTYNAAAADIEDLQMAVVWYDNLIMGCEGYKNYIKDAGHFVSKHAGGIIGDHIKEQYFSAGKHEWPRLSLKTLHKKSDLQRRYNRMAGVSMPYASVPMWGITSTQNLPDDWHEYTYKYAGWPRGASVMGRTAAFLTVQAKGFGAAAPKTMRTGEFIKRKQYTKTGHSYGRKYGIPYVGIDKATKRMYAPSDRVSLMDITAHLAPNAFYSTDKKGTVKVSVGDIIEPFGQAPWVFNHERGYTTNRGAKVPVRAFIGPGIKNGVNDTVRLLNEYIKDGNTKIRQGINISGNRIWRSSQIDSMYGAFYSADVYKKYAGGRGIRPPSHAVYTRDDVGIINQKVQASKKAVSSMFNSRLIWWLLPPSKYYHYIGMGFDVASVMMGGFWSLGAAQAWIQAMSQGMLGARLGTPIAFTHKARRRQFRKGLYTRAGYHRSGSLGTGRSGR